MIVDCVRVVMFVGAGMLVSCGKGKSAPDAGQSSVPARPAFVRPNPSAGELPIDVAKSKVALSIIKDRDYKSPVGASIALRDGAVSMDKGTARLSFDLDTFDSGIPLRNERVRGIIFETSAVGWESAELKIDAIPDALLSALRAKKPAHGTVDGDLTVHGRTTKLALPLDAAYDGAVLSVRSARPIEVKVSALGLTENVKRLSALCMHDSIDDVVKVEVALVFTPR